VTDRSPRAVLKLPFPAIIALRYLRSTRRDAFVSFLSLTAAGGIALGVAALILALAALTGFQNLLKEEILTRTPQVQLRLPVETTSEELAEISTRLAALSDVTGVRRYVRGRLWLVGDGSVRAVQAVGHDGEPPSSLFPGTSSAVSGLFVSDRMASLWGLRPGDVVEVASSKPTLSPVGPQPRVRRLSLAGTFEAGRTEQDERAALPLEEAGRLLGRRETFVEASTDSLGAALDVRPLAEAILVDAGVDGTVETWQDLNRALFFALRLEKGVMFVAVFLIVVVAALALITGISLLISKKRPEIGMLGAMGAAPRTLARAFVLLGGLLAVSGILVGLIIGVTAAWLLDRFELVTLPSEVYFVDHVPFAVRFIDVGGVLAATLVIALACSAYAASRAASLLPIEALRR